MGMITNVTSFGRSGLSDWILQRANCRCYDGIHGFYYGLSAD